MRSTPRQGEQLRAIGGCLRSVYEVKHDGELQSLLAQLTAIKTPAR